MAGELSRQNGRKSKGPKTQYGKAIASRNAFKHGLTSKQLPVLLSENKDALRDLTKSLTAEYQPASTVEALLVQQIAFAALRQMRLWHAEAASSNHALLKQTIDREFPDIPVPTETPADYLKIEQNALSALARVIESASAEEISPIVDAIDRAAIASAANSPIRQRLLALSAIAHRSTNPEAFVKTAQDSLTFITDRIRGIDSAIERYHTLSEQLQNAERQMTVLQNPDLYLRYQSEISHQLHSALDRLFAEKQRNLNASNGFVSFSGDE